MEKRNLKKKNLVFLTIGENSCYFNLDTKIPDKLKLNLEAKTWQYDGRDVFKIGNSSCGDCGTIGVYDRHNIRHLRAMVSELTERLSHVSSYSMD